VHGHQRRQQQRLGVLEVVVEDKADVVGREHDGCLVVVAQPVKGGSGCECRTLREHDHGHASAHSSAA
jgi:hypothetical protein